MIAYNIPEGISRSTCFKVEINGQSVEAGSTGAADFITLATDKPFVVEVTVPSAIRSVTVRPLRLEVHAIVDGQTLRCSFAGPVNASIEIAGFKPLFIYANAPEAARPDPQDPSVHYYGGGKIHEAGIITLRTGETLYIEGGTVVRGSVQAKEASDIRLAGHGILDGSCFSAAHKHHLVVLDRCRNVQIENLVLIEPTTWMIVLGDCDQVIINNVREIGEVVCSDGIDIVGSRNVQIENCFLVNNDDCVVIKSSDKCSSKEQTRNDWRQDVRDITVRGCTLLNLGSGNAMEIGFELCTEIIENVVFEDIDVIAAHQYAAVFSIHNGDRATVRNIRYENIRVEHYWNKLIDFRVLLSRYTRDAERGRIQNILLKNIYCVPNIHNTPSLIGGYDADHLVEGITFENFFIGDQKVLNGNDLHLFTRNAQEIAFR